MTNKEKLIHEIVNAKLDLMTEEDLQRYFLETAVHELLHYASDDEILEEYQSAVLGIYDE